MHTQLFWPPWTLAFKPITVKFGKFTKFWMRFHMTCPIFNSIDGEYSYQVKECSYPVPGSFRTWQITMSIKFCIAHLYEDLNNVLSHCRWKEFDRPINYIWKYTILSMQSQHMTVIECHTKILNTGDHAHTAILTFLDLDTTGKNIHQGQVPTPDVRVIEVSIKTDMTVTREKQWQ